MEATFEIFTTVIVAYLHREMGIVSKAKAQRTTYIAWNRSCCRDKVYLPA